MTENKSTMRDGTAQNKTTGGERKTETEIDPTDSGHTPQPDGQRK